MSFTENVIQKSHVNVYYPGSNHCLGSTTCDSSTPVATCDGCDWEFSQVTCKQGCPSQPACSEIDGNTCPNLGENVQYQWDTGSNGTCPIEPLIKCTYDAKTFKYSDVLQYQQDFCKETGVPICTGNSNYNNIIMPEFCFDSTTICPIVPGTKSSWQNCPNILSNITGSDSNNPGATCSTWSSSNKNLADTTMLNYCKNNSTDGTCKCINKNNSTVYNYINTGMQQSGNFNSTCWYTPCANPQAYLVPSTSSNVSCNMTPLCARVNQIISTTPTNLTKAQLQAELNCSITSTPTPIDPNNTGTSSATNIPINNVQTTSNFWWIILIIVVVIIILIILFFIFYGNSGSTTTIAIR